MLKALVQYLEKTVRLVAQFVVILFFVRFFLLEPGVVDGLSMGPSFQDGELFLVNKIGPLVKPLARYDVVQFFPPNVAGVLVIKRVIGLPKEEVWIAKNRIWVRGEDGVERALAEPYLHEQAITNVPFGFSTRVRVPLNSYLLIGDNRLQSTDSRVFGPVYRTQIVGKIIALKGAPSF